ncbi:MAG: tetratricopeptide repeat protein [Saprospiraceae bacterium]|nr:tetratricopeptide repeat protein [Saprospiraceae bacterium]
MKKAILLFISFLFALTFLSAQVNAGYLWRVWNNPTLQDTVRLNAMQQLAYSYVNKHPDSTRMLAQEQLAFAREKGLLGWQARALNSIGLSYRFQSNYAKAIQHYEQSLALLAKAPDRNYMATVYRNMADVYRIQSNLPKAIDYITKSLQLATETGDQKMAADGYVSIATIYYEIPGQDSIILDYLEKARKIYEALGNENGLSFVYGNLSAVYLDQNEFDKALIFGEKTMALQQKSGNRHGLATSLHNRAVIRCYQGRYQEAMADFDQEIEIFQEMGDEEGLADAYISMGDLWLQLKRYPMAIQVCSNALGIARRLGSPNQEERYACECLYTAFQMQGNYRKALEYLEQAVIVKDSLQQYETEQKLKQMEIQRQMAIDSLDREKENFRVQMAHQQTLRNKDRTLNWLTVGVLGVLIVALAFLVRMLYFRRRSQLLQLRSDELERQQLLNEVALLRSQVNPHFLFNSLSILSSLVRVNADLSEQFIDQLSRSYRYILEQKEQSLVSLRTELEFIQAYSFLLKIRFEQKYDLRIELPEEILDTCKIAPLTLQLLIENAVKHNRMSVKEPLVVTVSVENKTLLVKNRLQLRATAPISTGVGLQNIINRYALLTKCRVWAGEEEDQFVVKVPLL